MGKTQHISSLTNRIWVIEFKTTSWRIYWHLYKKGPRGTIKYPQIVILDWAIKVLQTPFHQGITSSFSFSLRQSLRCIPISDIQNYISRNKLNWMKANVNNDVCRDHTPEWSWSNARAAWRRPQVTAKLNEVCGRQSRHSLHWYVSPQRVEQRYPGADFITSRLSSAPFLPKAEQVLSQWDKTLHLKKTFCPAQL